MSDAANSYAGLRIAIIGMAGRFPGAKDTEALWHLLCNGVEGISALTEADLLASGVSAEELASPHYVRAAPVLDDIEHFDAAFFGITPIEARVMDPQQRLLLECAWEALEQAGYDPLEYPEPISVFAGARTSTYLFHLLKNRVVIDPQQRLLVVLGNDVSTTATRISYSLNLTGPSYSVQTACSTSLTALHLACQSLLMGECRMALAAAATAQAPHRVGYFHDQSAILSTDGHCRPFDQHAQGTVFGSGVGAVVLKRLDDALTDGDSILAVVRGTATNNDGTQKASYTAPSVEGQTQVILEALACAGVDADSISYLEAHGTATSLGDPIEIMAATNAYRASTDKKAFCRLGTIKGNVGHLDAAAGMAGLIKTILSLQHRQLPPLLHYTGPNPQIDFASSPFVVNTRLTEWTGPVPLRAAVSSFGFGGTNAHVILEQAPEGGPTAPSRPWQLLTLSARSASALDAAISRLAEHLRSHPTIPLADVTHTLQRGRHAFAHRAVLLCQDSADAAVALAARAPGRLFRGRQAASPPPVAFLFPGQGAQYVAMGREVYESEPTFRAEVDRCLAWLLKDAGLDLRPVLFPVPGGEEQASNQLQQTAVTQPALFTIEYSLAKLWMSWGVIPHSMVGHSLGEYVAACLAGLFSVEDAIRLVAARGRMMQELPAGAMLSVALAEPELRPLLGPQLDLAAQNGPASCVVSGPVSALQDLESQLLARDIPHRRLPTSHAFHSAMMAPLVEPFADIVRAVPLRPPQIPYLSNVTGTWVTAEQATDPYYWALQLRRPVQFEQAVQTLLQEPELLLLEVGPGNTLGSLVRQNPKAASHQVLASLRHPQQPDGNILLTALGRLWMTGQRVDWQAYYAHERRQRIPLPTYPFERQRFWVDPLRGPQPASGLPNVEDATLKRRPLEEWFYLPSWQQTMVPPRRQAAARPQRWLVFSDGSNLSVLLANQLVSAGHHTVVVTAGREFRWSSGEACTLDPERRADYDTLIRQLAASARFPDRIAHLWSMVPLDPSLTEDARFAVCQQLGFYSLLFLAQALGESGSTAPLQLVVVSTQTYAIEQADIVQPEKATILGPTRVIPKEYPHITCRYLDIAQPAPETARERSFIQQLAAELTGDAADAVICYRGPQRWLQVFERVKLGAQEAGMQRLHRAGRYLITGGLGGIGLVLAEFMAKTYQARLVLVGRSVLPARGAWDAWLTSHEAADPISVRLRKLQELEAAGAELLILSADVTSVDQMQGVLDQVRARWGALDGVIHAAGVAGGGLIQLKTPEAADRVMGPKVGGTRVLAKILREESLDFFLLFSSISSVVGELGQVDYCAANAFLDAFAQACSSQPGFTMAVNWDMWRDAGMATSQQLPSALRAWRELQLSMAIRSEEGSAALSLILAGSTSCQLVVSTAPLPELLKQLGTLTGGSMLATLTRSANPEQAQLRPTMATPYVAPRSEVERSLADIWQRLLGVQDVGVHDSFFDLGGHSLVGTQLRNAILSTFKVDLPLPRLFEAPTIAAIAELIEKPRGATTSPPALPLSERLQRAFPTDRVGILEEYLHERRASASRHATAELPADGSLAGVELRMWTAELQYRLKQDLQFQIYPHEVIQHPTIPDLARYLLDELDQWTHPEQFLSEKPLSAWTLTPYRKGAVGKPRAPARKNPSMVFLHSSPRAGSTLFRVMLAGHPRLFCPPELNLLFFNSMREWRQNLGMGQQFEWTDEGLRWAHMELMGLEPAAGQQFLDDLVARDVPVQEVLARLQELASPRLLLDKTPIYALDPATLEKSETYFAEAKYIYLYRHPLPVMESLLRLRMNRTFGPVLFQDSDVDPHAVAETVWALCNRNLLEFFDRIDRRRSHWVRYEDLVESPEQVMRGVCDFLEIPFDPRVLVPYDGKRERMLGGLGDPNIMQHQGIEAGLGQAWKRIKWPRPLDPTTLAVCDRLGYKIESTSVAPRATAPKPPMTVAEAEGLLANMDQLSDEQVAALLNVLSGEATRGA